MVISAKIASIQEIDGPGRDAAEQKQPRQRMLRPLVFVASCAFSLMAFLTMDYLYSTVLPRQELSTRDEGTCVVDDPVRHHTFKPNCAIIDHWGQNYYPFFTNSLGFRDEKVREVPLADPKPRILLVGDSLTEGKIQWSDSFVGKIAARLPQYDFLNAGVMLYSASNYLNQVRLVLAKGVDIDEVIVFTNSSGVQLEAGVYRDIDGSGAVTEDRADDRPPLWRKLRNRLRSNFWISSGLFEASQRFLVRLGFFHVEQGPWQNLFDSERNAWTYRSVSDTRPNPLGYAPLGLKGGLARENEKMTLLWQELRARNIAFSIVVLPTPPQMAHDTVDSRVVQIWRGWCEGKCKRFISLFPAFDAVREHCPPLQSGCWYFTEFVFGDSHYTPVGNAMIAHVVTASLTNDPPVKTGAKPQSVVNLRAASQRRGTLISTRSQLP